MENYEKKRKLGDRRKHNYGPDWDIMTGQPLPERRKGPRRREPEIPELIKHIYLL